MIDALSAVATAHFQASTVIAASIGGVAVIVAAVVGTWPSRRATSYEKFVKDIEAALHKEIERVIKRLPKE